VFMSQGQVMGVLLPGQHTLDAREIPFLGMFVDWASAGNAFRAEIFFVGTREFPNNRFGGRLDEVQDPVSGLIVTLRTFGEYSLRVNDPTKVILNLVGTVDVTDNNAVTAWVTQQLLKVTRTTVTTQLMSGAWPILGLSMHSPEIEAQSLEAANRELGDYGITLTRLGNVDVNLDDDDNARLKKLAGDTAYSRLAGGFLQAAQAEALQGAGQGMAQGGGAVTPMFLGAGLGMAGQMMQAPAQAPYNPPPPGTGFAGGGPGYAQQAAAAPPAAPAPAAAAPTAPAAEAAMVACSNCSSPVQVGAKFCGECGTPTPRRRRHNPARNLSARYHHSHHRPFCADVVPAAQSPSSRKACPDGQDRMSVVQGSERAGADKLHDLRRPARQEEPRL
jgi:membrane protease subunit (stomatin/prohibitin family)